MEKLIVIDDLAQLETLIACIENSKDRLYIAVDCETTGVEKDSKIIGLSFCYEDHKSYYVIVKAWQDGQLITLPTENSIGLLLRAIMNHHLLMHNGVFDCSMIKNNYGIDLMPSLSVDTMILSHLLDENRSNGLKDLGVSIFGDDAKKEQLEMKSSIEKNGGSLKKNNYELYKADAHIIGKYGAKDALLTFKLAWVFLQELEQQNLVDFFYQESMPLLRGPTYDLNTTGLRVDDAKLTLLQKELESESLELKAFIYKEISVHISEKYPATNKKNTFNITSSQQIAWLLFEKLGNLFSTLTDGGKLACEKLGMKLPYNASAKRQFISLCKQNPDVVGNFWKYTKVDKEVLSEFSNKYKWVEALLKYSKNKKLLTTYVEGIKSRSRYNIIYPSFVQIGTTSGRYSSKNPNFQNLPRDDKRIKASIVARPGKVFVGADYSQLEPRVFASVSQDPTLMDCFDKGQDFYSVVGSGIFDKTDCSLIKDEENSFAKKYPALRNISKAFSLATPYGTSAFQQSQKLHKHRDECQQIIDSYFNAYPKVEQMMLLSHEMAKDSGSVFSLYGRPRRIPEALNIRKIYGKNTPHSELPYTARTLLNLAMNHRVQSSAASIVNRASIALYNRIQEAGLSAKIVLQVHDSIIVECLESDQEIIMHYLQDCMENTTVLPGVKLQAIPQVGYNLAEV